MNFSVCFSGRGIRGELVRCVDYHITEEYGVYITRQVKHLADKKVITQYLRIIDRY